MLLNFVKNVSKHPVPLYGVSFSNERGVLGADMLALDCDGFPTVTGGADRCVGGCTMSTGTANRPVPLAC